MASGLSFSSSTRFVNTTLERGQRALIFIFVATSLMSLCLVRIAYLQLVQGNYNRHLAERNRLRLIPIASDRGNIVDRQGKLLAANRLSRSVYLWPKEQSAEQWQQTVTRLGPLLGVESQTILQQLTQAGYHSPMPVRVQQNLSPSAFVALAEQFAQVPGIEIRAESHRYYPHQSLAAHILGYIGEANETTLKAHPEFPMGMIVGQMGIERIADDKLRGVWGSRLIETDNRGQELRMLGIQPAKPGQQVQLTLDLELQKVAEKALNNRRGAVVAMDVKTGAVRVLASGPTFDPNLFTGRISESDWKQLQSTEQPFLNRALQGYPPGSTFKIVTSTAGMESGKFSPDSLIMTSAYISLGGIQFWEHGSGGYGAIGFRDALAFSSNTFFYQIGLAVGPEQISKWGHQLGIGTTSNMGLEGGSHGLIPTPEEKQKLYDEPWYGGDTVSMAIGQGLVQVTPLEEAVMVSAIANGGWRVKPHLFASETPKMLKERVKTGIKDSTRNTIRSGLIAVVQQGTARSLNDGSIPQTAGKTGTAEVPGQPDNALFVGYGPVDDPQIAVAVVVENGGFGAVSAVPIAHEIYKTYFKQTGLKPSSSPSAPHP